MVPCLTFIFVENGRNFERKIEDFFSPFENYLKRINFQLYSKEKLKTKAFQFQGFFFLIQTIQFRQRKEVQYFAPNQIFQSNFCQRDKLKEFKG